MGLYKLVLRNSGDLSSGYLQKAVDESIDYEKDFENWLENSPNLLFEEDGETIIWIGRQVRISTEDTGKYLDLLGIDSSGDVVIVELKKGRTPREVIAQILEYSAWIDNLNYEVLNEIAHNYFLSKNLGEKSLMQAYRDVFFPDDEAGGEDTKIEFNRSQKLFIVAEDITPTIRRVTSHLRAKYQMNIFCIEYKVQKTEQGDYFISTERIGGIEEIGVGRKKSISSSTRWNQPIKIKDLIYDAVKNITGSKYDNTFSPADVYKLLVKEYPEINRSTVGCQIIQDCVNHTSRKHYPGGQKDFYFKVEKGVFRLYNPEKDGKWDSEGKRI
jgi:hypothetical protein